MSSSHRFEVTIEKIVAGGDGIGRHEGKVVFVPQAVPGEELRVEAVENRRDYIRAEITQVLTDSPLRREPPCPLFGHCGGCSLMHLTPEAQIQAKRGILLESLQRGGGLEFPGEIHTRAGPEWGYRSRARFHVKLVREGPLVGFKARGSHRIVDVNRCLLISDEANVVLSKVRQWFADDPHRAATVLQFEILQSTVDSFCKGTDVGRILLHFVVKKGRGPSRTEVETLCREGGLDGLVVTEEDTGESRSRHRIGPSRTMHRVGGIEYRTTVGSFFQVNRFLLTELVEQVLTPEPVTPEKVADLYCGVGLFSLPLARRAQSVTGVESSSVALVDAEDNARRNDVENVDFVHAHARDYVAWDGLSAASLVVVDPPRGGLERAICGALVRHHCPELRYVSCDPAAWGRDAGRLSRGGLELQRVVLMDLFPNTHHFETVTVFRPRTE